MAAAGRFQMFNELNRARISSPNHEEFATAHSTNTFDAANEAIHSTLQFDGDTAQHSASAYQQGPTAPQQRSEDGSTEMSIEVGRGGKRTYAHERDVSSSFHFDMGDESIYSLTTTPPLRPKTSHRKSDGAQRKEANIATIRDSAPKRAFPSAKHRSLSEALKKMDAESNGSQNAKDFAERRGSARTRNTRFASRQVSTTAVHADGTPLKMGEYNNTVQTATWTGQTAQSFALPDMSNIMELVGGISKHGTPGTVRSVKRSRFASATYRPNPSHAEIESVPVPEDEKAIYTSLLILREKVAQLEVEKSEGERRADEQEDEIIRLTSELEAERRLRNNDSALGSDEESDAGKYRAEKARLQANIKTLQDRLDKSDRKVSNADIAVKRITKERDNVMARFAMENEELKAENDGFRDAQGRLGAEIEDLRHETNDLQTENEELRIQLALATARDNTGTRQFQSRRSGTTARQDIRAEIAENLQDVTDQITELDIADFGKGKSTTGGDVTRQNTATQPIGDATSKLEKDMPAAFVDLVAQLWVEMQKQLTATSTREYGNTGNSQRLHPSNTKSRSRSQQREVTSTAAGSTPLVTDNEDSVEMSLTRHARDTLRRMHFPTSGKPSGAKQEHSKDLTQLTNLGLNVIDAVRRKVEEDRKFGREEKRHASATLPQQRDATARSIPEGFTGPKRRSSLRDVTGTLNNVTRRSTIYGDKADEATKGAKTVRVQSPHVSDRSVRMDDESQIVDGSIFSNTSRRRRRATAAEEDGETSAFIVPDITIHSGKALPQLKIQHIHHDAASCTECPHETTEVDIPAPVPVTEKDVGNITDATIRPALAPAVALARVLKRLEDEVTHLKLLKTEQEQLYNQHDPAISRRRRLAVKSKIDELYAMIEKKSQNIYDLNDVLLGKGNQMIKDDVDETLQSIGIDPMELSGHVGRGGPAGLDNADVHSSDAESDELPWEGVSDVESGVDGEEKQMV